MLRYESVSSTSPVVGNEIPHYMHCDLVGHDNWDTVDEP